MDKETLVSIKGVFFFSRDFKKNVIFGFNTFKVKLIKKCFIDFLSKWWNIFPKTVVLEKLCREEKSTT